ncbi:MAG: BrnT family toxin [Gammaproteobacteria bacterium]
MPDDDPGEDRFIGLGIDPLGRLLVVVYTFRGEKIRVISARRATPSERRTYERNLP